MPETPVPDQDPVTSKSLSRILLVSSILLVITFVWALMDETFFLRPWKGYQRDFSRLYTAYLKKVQPVQSRDEETIRKSSAYQQLSKQLEDAGKAAAPELDRIAKELDAIRGRLDVLTPKFQEIRSHIAAITYDLEEASEGSKASYRKDIDKLRKNRETLDLPKLGAAGTERVQWDFDQMEKEYNRLKDRRAQLQAEQIKVNGPSTEIQTKLGAYLKEQMTGLTKEQIQGLIEKMDQFDVDIKQLHIKQIDLVDRCESCHVGTREPVELTKASMGGREEFVSHPEKDLLKIHDPERFGCTPCHNGNGIATTSVEKGHGYYEHWLWPLYRKENIQAGCQQCHSNEIVTDYAETLNQGRELFRGKGCMGCHRFEGFDREPEVLQAANQQSRQINMEKGDAEREMNRSLSKMDDPKTPDAELPRLRARADQLRVNINKMNEKLETLDTQSASLLREIKKVGPTWKELRMKVRKEWIPVWIKDPHEFRPTTKMPTFRLTEEERQAIAAFVWQSAVDGPALPDQPKGDAGRGKELFETRGCMACHSVGEGSNMQGGTFAANLSRVGEKANYNYLVRWVHNPRERTRPYCTLEKRDIGPEDYTKHGKTFQFDLQHAQCPNDGTTMQVQQMTPMPSLRLTTEEARDIATYLTTLQRPNVQYPAAPYMDDPKLKERGTKLVRNYGCAGCHEISGLEDEGRIGTDLTKEGTKPIERLDFGLLTYKAKKKDWYNHKGFFEHKLEKPEVYDQGKEKPQEERLRMPNFHLAKNEIAGLTTLLLGAVDSQLPEYYFYKPQDQRRDIQEGWWIVRKYNCMGCHVLRANQQTVFMTLPRYQDPDWKEQMPPQLVGEGARVDPQWLVRFLSNPPLSETDTNRNGVRTYLKARMPTFFFSEGEVDKLVRFFMAVSSQPSPFIQTKKNLDPLSDNERNLARALFSSKGAPCLKCHATGNAQHDARATAPNFLSARERLKPGWTLRWMLDPAMIAPGTAMPSGLFRHEGNRWVFNGQTPEGFKTYSGDHAELLVRYMFQFTPDELRRLQSAGGGAGQ